MKHNYILSLTTAALCGVNVCTGLGGQESSQKDKAAGDKPPSAQAYSTDQAIQFFVERVQRDPADASNSALLGQLYVRKARETNDFSSYEKAEAAFRAALKVNADEVTAQTGLALVHCARHQFAEGLRVAQQIQQKHPSEQMILLIIGDAQLELGKYAEADRAYQDLRRVHPEAPVRSRLARLAEIKGNLPEALRLMQQAADQERGSEVTKQSGAWYDLRLAEMHYNGGHLEDAARHYEAALKDHPSYPAVLAGLARVRAAQGKSDEAIELYKKAVRLNPDFTSLAALGDLYAKTGQDFLARIIYEKLDKTSTDQPPHYRELSLYYANHDQKLPVALELAQKDLALRKDVYALDTLAWALFKNNKSAEAAQVIGQALKVGTQEATLFYHAGMIYRALGEKDKARDLLKRALALNPQFCVLQADIARKALAELSG
ncbi:MAG TPA: tetratricopeptide repeat protein [Gemmataceae bacterium]|nr:tetratricopeptide repeat protein [Gemmataceae bacterium]